jgi:hypothetical protein
VGFSAEKTNTSALVYEVDLMKIYFSLLDFCRVTWKVSLGSSYTN